MEIKVQKRIINKKYKNYYVNLPKEILRKAGWLKKQKVVEIEVDLLGHVTIKPK